MGSAATCHPTANQGTCCSGSFGSCSSYRACSACSWTGYCLRAGSGAPQCAIHFAQTYRSGAAPLGSDRRAIPCAFYIACLFGCAVARE